MKKTTKKIFDKTYKRLLRNRRLNHNKKLRNIAREISEFYFNKINENLFEVMCRSAEIDFRKSSYTVSASFGMTYYDKSLVSILEKYIPLKKRRKK